MPAGGLAPGVQIQQLGGHVADAVGGFLFFAVPAVAAQLRERGIFAAAVAGDLVEGGDGNMEHIPVQIFDGQVFTDDPADVEGFKPAITPDSVIDMHHRLPLLQLGQIADEALG